MDSSKHPNLFFVRLQMDAEKPESLKDFELIKQGAEARIYKGLFDNAQPAIAKQRFKKTYRHPELDKTLTVKRIRNEVKLLNKASTFGVNVPKVLKSDEQNGIIVMEFIERAQMCKDFIKETVANCEAVSANEKLDKMASEIGRVIGVLHRNEIIHGDLTTSNMLLQEAADGAHKLYFIDFGLSFISSSLEDKAVDLYVLERALTSTHSRQAAQIFEKILHSYTAEYGRNVEKVIERFEQVRLREANGTMYAKIQLIGLKITKKI